jgi:hypothetical protein
MTYEGIDRLVVRGHDGGMLLHELALSEAYEEFSRAVRKMRHEGCTSHQCEAGRWDCPRQG